MAGDGFTTRFPIHIRIHISILTITLNPNPITATFNPNHILPMLNRRIMIPTQALPSIVSGGGTYFITGTNVTLRI